VGVSFLFSPITNNQPFTDSKTQSNPYSNKPIFTIKHIVLNIQTTNHLQNHLETQSNQQKLTKSTIKPILKASNRNSIFNQKQTNLQSNPSKDETKNKYL
jgi:hypothetical protein